MGDIIVIIMKSHSNSDNSDSVPIPSPPPPADGDDSLVCLANAILSQCHVDRVVESFVEIDVDLFVTVFEALAGERLNDVFRPAATEDERVHNAQVVIDSLSMDILHTSLSHVEGIVEFKNLLQAEWQNAIPDQKHCSRNV